MATEPVVIVFQAAVVRRYGPAGSTLLADYWALTKPGVNFLIVITTFSGFYLGCAAGWHDFPFVRAINLVIGTLLVASGTGTLNQYLERPIRYPNAADCPARIGLGTAQNFRCAAIRNRVVGAQKCLSRGRGERTGKPARISNVAVLFSWFTLRSHERLRCALWSGRSPAPCRP
jgi:hypothetical protein